MAAISIWKDTYFSISASASPFSYSITTGGETIFNGKAFVAPQEQTIKIKVNEICKDYLTMDRPNLTPPGINITQKIHTEATRTFEVNDSIGNTLSSYTFTMDWSYAVDGYSANTVVSRPINYHAKDGMTLLKSTYQESNGRIYTQTTRKPDSFGYHNDYCANGDWAFYYLNSFGGWDSFLIEGVVRRKDEFNRLTISTPYDNTTLDWGKRTYNNQITPSWEATTGYLTDTESEILAKNLLRSNQVYLHHISTGEIWPVLLTDSTIEHKTFKNNGRRFITYTINAEASHTEQNVG